MTIREQIQKQAKELLIKHNDIGCLGLSMGLGKSKIIIDRIKEGNYKNILITGYRSSLKENWKKELYKWGEYAPGHNREAIDDSRAWIKTSYEDARIQIHNIQTAYKWNKEQIQQFDLVVFDESHELFTPEYSKLLINAAELGIRRISLSGTPDYKNKKEFYDKYCPILMEYYDVEGDITNEVKVIVFEYELSNEYKVLTSNKTKQWYVGEKKQYEYLTDQYEKAKALMYQQGAENYFDQSIEWMQSKTVSKEQKEAGSKFFYATKARKEFLWNLNSSATIARLIKNKILGYSEQKIETGNLKWWDSTKKFNKVLLFSQLTEQCNKLSQYRVHSKTGKTTKESERINTEILDKFNKGEIRELASVKSLTTGVSIKNLNWIVVESFDSSDIKLSQIRGRGRRLELGETANMIIIVPKGTQAETWVKSGLGDMKYEIITNLNQLSI